MNGLVTLLSDFGTQDGYVGAMKGVLFREHPAVRVVDLSHEVPAQDVVAGAFALAQAAPWFPPGTIHVAVVDPTVGTGRRALVIEAGGSIFIGPDNGLLTLAARLDGAGTATWAIDRVPESWSVHPTFHGRDLFARVAARLAAGAEVREFARCPVDPVRLAVPRPERRGDHWHGVVVHVDRFGNLITNLPADTVGEGLVEVEGVSAPRVSTYGQVERGQLLACPSSSGHLEIAIRDGSAAATLHARRGARVRASARP